MNRFLLFLIPCLTSGLAAPRGGARYALILEDPPVAMRVTARAQVRGPAGRAAARAIEASQQRVRQQLAARGFHVTGAVNTLLNAVFVEASPADVPRLRSLSGVRRIAPLPLLKPALDQAVQLVDVADAWALPVIGGQQNAGAGVKIAVIDSGIDQTHAAFQDSSLTPPSGLPACSTAPGGNNCDYTNKKVVVARSYVYLDAAGAPGNFAATSRPDDLSPRDRSGHGTAVAMIAAGGTNTPSGGGPTITGMAPKAFLGNYKVFGSPGVNDVTFSDVVLTALEDALADGMDIAVLALTTQAFYGPLDVNTGGFCSGGPDNEFCDAWASAVQNAATQGLAVVVAAGNDGATGVDANGNPTTPTFNTMNTPGTAPAAIAAGASTNAHDWFASVVPGGNLGAIKAVFGSGPKLAAAYGPFPLKAAPGDGFACTALQSGSLTGSIVLIQRNAPSATNGCDFATKIDNAQNAGAVGAVIYRENGQDALFEMTGLAETGIPAVLVSNTDGRRLKSYAANAGAQVRLDPAIQSQFSQFNVMAPFSSHGPSIGDVGQNTNPPQAAVKPDLVAPGTGIFTATQSYDPNGSLYSATGYTSATGTSFSAAMVAGGAALVKQAHPGFTPAQLKSALVNTASTQDVVENNQTADVRAVGGGKLNTPNAVKTDVTVEPASISFGILARGTLPITTVLTVSRTGLTATVEPVTRDPNTVITATVAGASISVKIDGSTPGLPPDPGFYYGNIVVHGGAVDLHVPYQYMVQEAQPRPASAFPISGSFVTGLPGDDAGLLAFKVVDQFGAPIQDADIQWSPTNLIGTDANHFADRTTDRFGIGAARPVLWSDLGAHQYIATVTANGRSIRVVFDAQVRPKPVIAAVVNAASVTPPPVAPGSYVTIYGTDLTPASRLFSDYVPQHYLPVSEAGVSVSFDNASGSISIPARVKDVVKTSTSGDIINLQVPWELAGQQQILMKVSIGGISSDVFTLNLNDSSPALFPDWAHGADWAVAHVFRNGALQLITDSNPAHPGEVVVLWCNGLGPLNGTPPPSGEEAPILSDLTPIKTRTVPQVTIGGVRASDVQYSGLTPTNIGLYQINVRVPDNVPAGNQLVTVSVNNVTSKALKLQIQ